MTLIKSISGIRGEIGGKVGDSLSPIDTVTFAIAYGTMLKLNNSKPSIVIGRDARMSGQMISNLVSSALISIGVDVVDLGISTTPTVEMAVPKLGASGGIILTASHNPKNWNALKLLNNKGEFISAEDGKQMLKIADNIHELSFVKVDDLGSISHNDSMLEYHINEILKLKWVDKEAIKNKNFRIVIDGINSSGSISVPALLDKIGVSQYEVINSEMTGDFAHNPEPLPEHLTQISSRIKESNADFGIVVDPDVDRLCFVCEDGMMFGEEYTLVAVADYILSKNKNSNTVSNLSSSRALRDVTMIHGGIYSAAAVGEVNVVNTMKETHAILGGEGNGGIILPELHYGRDALVGIAIFLSYVAEKNAKLSEIKATLPLYEMSKNKIELTPDIDTDKILVKLYEKFSKDCMCSTIDGLKIDFDQSWVHLRKSNTEPIIRIYSEAKSKIEADNLAARFIKEIKQII